jgi:hypothetical protein
MGGSDPGSIHLAGFDHDGGRGLTSIGKYLARRIASSSPATPRRIASKSEMRFASNGAVAA